MSSTMPVCTGDGTGAIFEHSETLSDFGLCLFFVLIKDDPKLFLTSYKPHFGALCTPFAHLFVYFANNHCPRRRTRPDLGYRCKQKGQKESSRGQAVRSKEVPR